MELKDTVDLMLSDDYKDRLKAEYYQLQIRCRKISKKLEKLYESEDNCCLHILEEQYMAMVKYRAILIQRLYSEEIEL